MEADNDLFAGLKIRIPGWARNEVLPGDLYSYLNQNDSNISLLINGENQQVYTENGYIILDKN